MSIPTGARGSSPRALRARPFGRVALLGLLALVAVGLAGTDTGPRPEQMILSGYGTSGPTSSAAVGSPPADKPAVTAGSFEIAGNVAGLYPGVTESLELTVTNPQGFAIVVTSIATTVQNASVSCTASHLKVTAFAGQLSVPALGSTTTAVLAKLASGTPNSCIGAAFPLVYSGRGRKA
jgi:hypothetical protein